MASSDDDGAAERLAQVRAQRRHLGRLWAAGRRDAAHERAADAAAEREADAGAEREADAGAEREVETGLGLDPLATPPVPSADTRTLLIAEQAALELDQAGLVADPESDDGLAMEL